MKRFFLIFTFFAFFLISHFGFSQENLFGQEFKVTKRTKLDFCREADGGWRFETGKIETEKNEPVVLVFFAESKDGQWVKKNLRSDKNGEVKIGVEGCDLTGRYVYYAYYADDKMFQHPSIRELLAVNGYMP
jgi:hypothetical protein